MNIKSMIVATVGILGIVSPEISNANPLSLGGRILLQPRGISQCDERGCMDMTSPEKQAQREIEREIERRNMEFYQRFREEYLYNGRYMFNNGNNIPRYAR